MSMFKKKQKISQPFSDKILDVITTLVLLVVLIIVAYPVIYTVSCSVSSVYALDAGKVMLWPVGFSVDGYRFMLEYEQFFIGFRNSVFYTFAGTLISLSLKIMMAYPISRPNFHAKGTYTKILLATMLVNAGMIPLFLIKVGLGMYNTIWAVIIPSTVGASHVFILRTAFKSTVPGELYDAAAIDGANEFQMMWKLAIPLCKATVSVITLYTLVGYWNDYFTALIYLNNETLQPLSMFLRNLLSLTDMPQEEAGANEEVINTGILQIKYASIVASTLPVLVAYWVVQGRFKTGVMIGSVKG